jgi:hypothetical protein
MHDRDELYRDVYWQLFDADLNPEDVYDMEAMWADEPGQSLHDLMRNNVRFPNRGDENSADILREICMQAGIKVYGFSYDDVVTDLVNIYTKSQWILNQVKR